MEKKGPKSFVFIEQDGYGGGLTKTTRTSIRRYIASSTSRKRSDNTQLIVLNTEFLQTQQQKGQCDTEEWSDNDLDISSIVATGPQGPVCGARVDRFNILSLPIENRRDMELMDHIATRLWPGFAAAFEGESNPFPTFWLPRCTTNPALLHALLFSSSCHLASRLSIAGQTPQTQQHKMQLLSHQAKAIVAVRQQLQNCQITSGEDIDDMLMITVSLATNALQGEIKMSTDPTPFYPTLTSGHWLDTYGALTSLNVHWNAVFVLLEKRGGVGNVKSFGLPWVITCASLNSAAVTLSKPVYPLLNPLGQPCKLRTCAELDPEDLWSSFCFGRGRAFYALDQLGLPTNVIETFVSLGNFSATLDAYCAGKIRNSLVDEIVESREVLQHRLLSLPHWYEIVSFDSPEPLLDTQSSHISLDLRAHLYEACRWAGQLYGIMVTFPIPRSKWAREHAVSNIRLELSHIPVLLGNTASLELQLWCTIVAGISSYDKEERMWFRGRAKTAVNILDIQLWNDAEGLMRRFAWVTNTCNPAALNFWSE